MNPDYDPIDQKIIELNGACNKEISEKESILLWITYPDNRIECPNCKEEYCVQVERLEDEEHTESTYDFELISSGGMCWRCLYTLYAIKGGTLV